MMKYIKFCKENCNLKMTRQKIITDTEHGCNFCDVSYYLLYNPEMEDKI